MGKFKDGKFDDKGVFAPKSNKWTYAGKFLNGTPNGNEVMAIWNK